LCCVDEEVVGGDWKSHSKWLMVRFEQEQCVGKEEDEEEYCRYLLVYTRASRIFLQLFI
jgi:hypothetical protein